METESQYLTFTLDEDDPKVEYETILTFFNKERGRNYIIYTDNTTDEMGNLNTYASIYDPQNADLELLPIETEEEWNNIENMLNQFYGGEVYE